MKFLKRAVIAGLVLLFAAQPAMAAEDVTARALKLYEKHLYDEAARLLQPELAGMDAGRQGAASLALGMIYLGSATLYRDFFQTALVIERDYFLQLGKQKTATPSRYVDLYLGQILLESGKNAEGAKYLHRFAARRGADPVSKSMAEIQLGIAYNRQKQQHKALHLWSAQDVNNPEIMAALAAAYAGGKLQNKKPLTLADAALQETRTRHASPGARMLVNLTRAYSEAGAPEKALDLLKYDEAGEASHVENLGASKMINFYDAGLLDALAKAYLDSAVLYLEKAGRDSKLSTTAAYYLADAYLQQGNAALSLQSSAAFLAQPQAPRRYRNVAQALQASAQNLTGKHAEAGAGWLSVAKNSRTDPASLAAVILSCAQAGGNCAGLEKLALAAIEQGEGKKFFPLNAALGKYYLLRKDYPKALLYMEAGRDKANKNKIEANDPLLLVGLAEAYYHNKKFSENLEIYFEISKQYPAVRQIQDAMQGIYAMEHQSAGDVKIF